jgi:protein phosphatase
MRGGLRSVTGNYRSVNEDSCYANLRDGLFLVADGIGGHTGGAIASQLLIDTIPPMLLPVLRPGSDAGALGEAIAESVRAAQHALVAAADCEPSLQEMGSTLVLGIVAGRSLWITHLGDSRAYLVRGNAIRRLTKDHSLVQALVDAGCLTPEAANRHRMRHVILDSVGANHECSPVNVQQVPLRAGDRLLFSTDGLTDFVDDAALAETMCEESNPQVAVDRLVKLALAMGSRDNVSCVVVHIENGDDD